MLSILHLICNFAEECIAKLGHPLHFLEYSLKMKSRAIKMTQNRQNSTRNLGGYYNNSIRLLNN